MLINCSPRQKVPWNACDQLREVGVHIKRTRLHSYFYPPKRQGPKRYSPIKGKNRPQRDSVRMLICVRFACSNLSYFSTPFWLIPLHILALCQVLCLLIIDLSSAYFNCRFWRDRCDAINHHSSLVSWKVGQSKSFLRQKLRWSKPLTQNYRPLKHKKH